MSAAFTSCPLHLPAAARRPRGNGKLCGVNCAGSPASRSTPSPGRSPREKFANRMHHEIRLLELDVVPACLGYDLTPPAGERRYSRVIS